MAMNFYARNTLSSALALAAFSLSGCAQSALRLSPDFGHAVNQDLAAQIDNPDAKYEGTLAPGSDGARVGQAQKRYQTNTVIQPSTITASSNASIGSADNGSQGSSAAPAAAP